MKKRVLRFTSALFAALAILVAGLWLSSYGRSIGAIGSFTHAEVGSRLPPDVAAFHLAHYVGVDWVDGRFFFGMTSRMDQRLPGWRSWTFNEQSGPSNFPLKCAGFVPPALCVLMALLFHSRSRRSKPDTRMPGWSATPTAA